MAANTHFKANANWGDYNKISKELKDTLEDIQTKCFQFSKLWISPFKNAGYYDISKISTPTVKDILHNQGRSIKLFIEGDILRTFLVIYTHDNIGSITINFDDVWKEKQLKFSLDIDTRSFDKNNLKGISYIIDNKEYYPNTSETDLCNMLDMLVTQSMEKLRSCLPTKSI